MSSRTCIYKPANRENPFADGDREEAASSAASASSREDGFTSEATIEKAAEEFNIEPARRARLIAEPAD